jgi:hypothetical protein
VLVLHWRHMTSGLPRASALTSIGLWLQILIQILMIQILILSGGLAAQTPVPRPAVPPTPQPATQVETSVRDALQQYSTALETLDADQVKKIYPTGDIEGLRRAFREMRELKVTIDNVKVLSTEGAIARVSCRVTQTLTPKAGARQNSAVTRVFRLRRQEAAWLIDGWER